MRKSTAEKLVGEINGIGFHAFLRQQGGDYTVIVSAEHGDSAADYYGEFRGGFPWINPKLEELAEKRGSFWEWESPGAISIWDET